MHKHWNHILMRNVISLCEPYVIFSLKSNWPHSHLPKPAVLPVHHDWQTSRPISGKYSIHKLYLPFPFCLTCYFVVGFVTLLCTSCQRTSLFVHLFAYLIACFLAYVFVCLCVCMFVCLLVCLFVCMLACLLDCLFACLFVCVFACLIICLPVYVCLCVCSLLFGLFFIGCLFVCLFAYVLTCLLVSVLAYLFVFFLMVGFNSFILIPMVWLFVLLDFFVFLFVCLHACL